MRLPRLVIFLCLVVVGAGVASAQWQPRRAPLMTRWAADVKPDAVLPEYPRPQLVRPDWQSLNGLWEYALAPRTQDRPARFEGQLLVPFPIESALSGVMQRVDPEQRLWYRRTFEVPAAWREQQVLLHCEAIDWEATIWVNGKEIGAHRGGYDPFSFEITPALRDSGAQELVIAVWDPTDAGTQPRGKQVREPHGIWYTPTTGIWQTIWLEPVPACRIDGLTITPDLDQSRFTVACDAQVLPAARRAALALEVAVLADGREVARETSAAGTFQVVVGVPQPRPWSPEQPFLYDLTIRLLDTSGPAPQAVDTVGSYAGLRKIALGTDKWGTPRLLLNNEPYFQYGPLDQGFWPDGLYTAPTDEALRYDLEFTKQIGCNMIRKHVKVEPRRWYTWCDRMGLLVWQDMPSGDRFPGKGEVEIQRTPESTAQYELELTRMIDTHRNHPCIVMWVPFNEGWGQFDTARIVELVRKLDPTRLVNNASGWHDREAGDVLDVHAYPGPICPFPEGKRAVVLGEFGGLGLPLKGHLWNEEQSWGYQSFDNENQLTDEYMDLIGRMRQMIDDPGLSAAVYTQTTDVEVEVNGILTYDRAVIKFELERVVPAHRKLVMPK